MTFRQWLAKKINGNKIVNPSQGVITDEMRERALATRRQEHALRQKEKEIAVMERILAIETKINPKESAMDKVVAEILPMLVEKMKSETNTKTGATIDVKNMSKEFSDEEIKCIVERNPKLKKFASEFNDEEIKGYIKQNIPNVSDSSLDKFIAEVRS